jgi:serine/threonine protein phosphatase 1
MKIFAVSDVHSFFTPMKKVLDEKGFEPNNPEHLLVVCGDCFDRGPESKEVLEFFNGLTNVILVKGNHEVLMEDVWERGHCRQHDLSNGTLRTIEDLCYSNTNEDLHDAVKLSEELLKPFFAKMVDYFETKKYVFVHGWIPMKYDTTKKFAEYGEPTLFDENWREGDWEEARWFNGIKKAHDGIIVPGKTIVCGHWHCSYGHMLKSIKTDKWISEFEEDAIWEPFVAEGIIAIDRCTAHTGEVNVVVLEDKLLEETEK